jgi:hypothetical protein
VKVSGDRENSDPVEDFNEHGATIQFALLEIISDLPDK